MKKNKWILLTLLPLSLSACTATSPGKNPNAYAESLKQAGTILKSNSAVEKHKKYYDAPNNKAIAQSKVTSGSSYTTNKTSKEYAKEIALERCHKRLLKRYNKITDRVSCEIVNVNNVWMR